MNKFCQKCGRPRLATASALCDVCTERQLSRKWHYPRAFSLPDRVLVELDDAMDYPLSMDDIREALND